MDPVLNHHLYEYEKGLRQLILHTVPCTALPAIRARLDSRDVAYEIVRCGARKANVFFGDPICIDVVRSIGKDRLSDYTPEEDFILGIMLGYCRKLQCERYLKLRQRALKPFEALAG